MKKKLLFLVIPVIVLVFGMSVFGCEYISKNGNDEVTNVISIEETPNRWEYTTLSSMVFGRTSNNGIHTLIERANELGEEGWELVSTSELNTGFPDRNLVMLFFKRKLP